MDLAGFQARYPEFKRVDPNILTLALAEAAASVSAAVFVGDAYDVAHGLYAADLVHASVYGGSARLEGEEPRRSRYRKMFWELYLQYVPRGTVA